MGRQRERIPQPDELVVAPPSCIPQPFQIACESGSLQIVRFGEAGLAEEQTPSDERS